MTNYKNQSLDAVVISILKKQPGVALKSMELAEIIKVKYPDWYGMKAIKTKSGRSPLKQIANEISSRRNVWLKKHMQLKCINSNPRSYYWDEEKLTTEKSAISVEPSNEKMLEEDLYPLVSYFLSIGPEQRSIYPKRINDKLSLKKNEKGVNEWLHPDLVGLEDLISEMDSQTKDCVEQSGGRRARLWSLEVKNYITVGDIRRYYFQAVSNSSWANIGYLVAAEIGEGVEKEARMLHAAHGIGLIKLNTDDPADSTIIIPAKEKADIDWDMCNRLVSVNKDFAKFIKLVTHFYKTNETSAREWEIPNLQSLSLARES